MKLLPTKNKKIYLLFTLSFILFFTASSFSNQKFTVFSSNQLLGDSTEYPVSELYLLKDSNILKKKPS